MSSRKVSEIVSSKIGDAITNVRIWGVLVYNVKENGLVGDGVTDDTTALQTLVDLAISEGRKAIAFPSGTYKVTALTDDDQVFFIGDNASFTGGYAGTIEQLGDIGVSQTEFDEHVAELASDVTPPHGMGAAAAEDYEEGSWTPELRFAGATTGITYASQVGRYIKIGKYVICEFQIVLSSKGTAVGDATIAGLPFATAAASPGRSGSLGDYRFITVPASTIQLTSQAGTSATSILLRAIIDGATSVNLNDTNFANGTQIFTSFNYVTD